MHKIFSGTIQKPQDILYHWPETLFITDTSVLLRLFQLQATDVEEVLGFLQEISLQLWAPYHLIAEYLMQQPRTVLTILQESRKLQNDLLNSIEHLLEQKELLPASLQPHHTVDLEKDLGSLTDSIDTSMQRYDEHARKLFQTIAELYTDKIGRPFDALTIEELDTLYQRRTFEQLHPVRMDDRVGVDRYQMVLGWLEILQKLKKEAVPVVFITDGHPAPWWEALPSVGFRTHRSLRAEAQGVLAVPFTIMELSDLMNIHRSR